MKRALLEIITGGIAVTPEDVAQYEKMTYFNTCLSELKNCDFKEVMGSTIDFLLDNEFITLQETEDVCWNEFVILICIFLITKLLLYPQLFFKQSISGYYSSIFSANLSIGYHIE